MLRLAILVSAASGLLLIEACGSLVVLLGQNGIEPQGDRQTILAVCGVLLAYIWGEYLVARNAIVAGLKAEIAEQKAENSELRTENTQLKEENKLLRNQLSGSSK